MAKFNEVLAELMKQHRLSDDELGKRIGVPPRTVGAWRRGEREEPERDNLNRLSYFFKVTPSFLMTGENRSTGKYEAVQVRYLSDAIGTMKSLRNRLDKRRSREMKNVEELENDIARLDAFIARFEDKDIENGEDDGHSESDRP